MRVLINPGHLPWRSLLATPQTGRRLSLCPGQPRSGTDSESPVPNPARSWHFGAKKGQPSGARPCPERSPRPPGPASGSGPGPARGPRCSPARPPGPARLTFEEIIVLVVAGAHGGWRGAGTGPGAERSGAGPSLQPPQRFRPPRSARPPTGASGAAAPPHDRARGSPAAAPSPRLPRAGSRPAPATPEHRAHLRQLLRGAVALRRGSDGRD